MLFAKQKFSTIKVRMSNINANANANNNNQIDFGLLPKNIPSLCIPRVFPNISEARIRKTFQDISIGRIENIEMIKGEKFNRVFVHLIWANTPDANYVRNQVMTGKDVKIIYDEPWFWMVSASRKPVVTTTQLSYKTDEFGRELRQPPPPTGPPPPQQRQQPRQQQPRQQRQQQQPRQQQPRQHYHQAPPPPAPLQRQYAHGQYEPPLLTDEFGREIRRQAPPPPPTPPPIRRVVPLHQPSWTSRDNEVDSDDEDNEEVKPRFIPQSPTSTPPSLRHKQIHPEEGAEEAHAQLKAQQAQLKAQEEEEEEGAIKEEDDDDAVSQAPTEDEEGSRTKKETRSSKIDIDQPSTMVEIKYDFVIPVKKLVRAKKTTKKTIVATEPEA